MGCTKSEKLLEDVILQKKSAVLRQICVSPQNKFLAHLPQLQNQPNGVWNWKYARNVETASSS